MRLPKLGLPAAMVFCAFVAEAQVVSFGPPRLGISTGLEYTDNWEQSEKKPEPDLKWTLTPNISETFQLPFVGGELTLANSATYKMSLMGREDATLDSPATANAALSVHLAGWQVTLTEQFGFKNDPLESTLTVREKEARTYDNTVGISATREFGKLSLALSLRRTDKIAPDTPEEEETTYELSLTPSYFLGQNFAVFWSHSLGINYPQDPSKPRSVIYNTNIGVNGRLTQTLNGSIGIGYAHTHQDPVSTATTNQPALDIDGPSAIVSLNYGHPLRPNTTHSLALAYAPGVTAMLKDSNAQETTAATYTLAHRLNYGLTLSPSVNWTHIRDVGRGGDGEITDLWRVGGALGGQVTDYLGATLNYFYQMRDSNLASEEYDAHQFSVRLTQRVTPRLQASLEYGYETQSFASGEEDDFTEHRFGFGLTQSFSRHLSGTLRYDRQVRDSKGEDDSYVENRVTVTLNYTF